MKKILSIILALVVFAAYGQQPEIVKIKGEGQITWDQDMTSKDAAKRDARELAEVNALEQAFGQVIIKGNSTYIKNKNDNEETQTNSTFNLIGNTYVPGEIVEIISEDYEEIEWTQKIDGKKVKRVDVKCVIVAKARKVSPTKVNFEVLTLSGNMKQNKAEAFKNGDSFYMYFRSSESGYLTVFIDDGKNAVRILPYSEMPAKFENGVPIEGDTDYILFSPKNPNFDSDKLDPEYYIDQIELACESDQDLNRVFVIFSKEPLNKPLLKDGLTADLLTDKEIEKKYTVPKAMYSEDFQRWMMNNMFKRDDFQRQTIDITIDKK